MISAEGAEQGRSGLCDDDKMPAASALTGAVDARRSRKAVWSVAAPLPTVRHCLTMVRVVLEDRFAELSVPSDTCSYHELGKVTPADEEAVMGGLAAVWEGLAQFARWSQVV